MLVNADFSRPVIITPDDYRWTASPHIGVERMMLDRVGAEKARATSIVRYAPESNFPLHTHPGGEEIFVLSGVFSDANGDYPAGWYIRNPPGSSHSPFTSSGAIIFVKLGQMASSGEQVVRIDTGSDAVWHCDTEQDVCSLIKSDAEEARVLRLVPGVPLLIKLATTAELLVITGSIRALGRLYRRGTWMRFPEGYLPDLTAGERGACLYIKTDNAATVE